MLHCTQVKKPWQQQSSAGSDTELGDDDNTGLRRPSAPDTSNKEISDDKASSSRAAAAAKEEKETEKMTRRSSKSEVVRVNEASKNKDVGQKTSDDGSKGLKRVSISETNKTTIGDDKVISAATAEVTEEQKDEEDDEEEENEEAGETQEGTEDGRDEEIDYEDSQPADDKEQELETSNYGSKGIKRSSVSAVTEIGGSRKSSVTLDRKSSVAGSEAATAAERQPEDETKEEGKTSDDPETDNLKTGEDAASEEANYRSEDNQDDDETGKDD